MKRLVKLVYEEWDGDEGPHNVEEELLILIDPRAGTIEGKTGRELKAAVDEFLAKLHRDDGEPYLEM